MPQPPLSLDPVRNQGAPLQGIAFKVTSVCVFLLMSTLLKASADIPPGELVFFRSFFALVPILIFMRSRGPLVSGLKTRHPYRQAARGIVGTTSMLLGFLALTRLPLAEAITINYATPLMIVVVGALFAGEIVRLYRWSAVLVGLVGVGVIVTPQLIGVSSTDPGATLGVIAALAATVLGGFTALLVRQLVETDRSVTVVFYFSAIASIISLATVPFGWRMPTLEQAGLLVGAGFAGGIGQILLTESFRRADMSVVAPFEYASLVLSIIVGYFVFQDMPTISMVVGGLIVTGSGLFIIFREHSLGINRNKTRRVTSVQH